MAVEAVAVFLLVAARAVALVAVHQVVEQDQDQERDQDEVADQECEGLEE